MDLHFFKHLIIIIVCYCITSCQSSIDKLNTDTLFTEVPTAVTGITFENKILESEKLHYYKYLYIYIGGGVAAADFNNDGLVDLFFTSNIYHNKLFLNKGNFEFEDITIKAGIKKRIGFDTGISIVDINNDGYLDIYINRAGWFKDEKKLANMLYINNGDLTFTEQASDYGIADSNRSISSTFFDYDKDGDLDLFISNAPDDYSISSKIIDFEKIKNSSKTAQLKGSDVLYQNNGNGFFTDVTKSAGISPDIGFGLHAQVGDLNNDGWLDIFVSNDFVTPDFAYLNNGDGTFTDARNDLFKHLSFYSMGSDIADINNDGLTDLMVLDMSPEDYIRSKTTMAMMSATKFDEMVANNYHHQYMHNSLQLNNGNGTYSEISNLAGVAQTDWSWSTLFADFDLDGYNDIYITNGVYRDVVDRDANNTINKLIKSQKKNLKEASFYEFSQMLPQQKLTNYFFKNNQNLSFENTTSTWSNAKPTFSNGAIYADLDNDGDLDIVVNNIDENATVLRNNARKNTSNNYLQIAFKGYNNNKKGIGTTVNLHLEDHSIQTRQLINNRGYLSSVSNKLHFGLGNVTHVPKLEIIWPNGDIQWIENVQSNQLLDIIYKSPLEKQNSDTLINNQHLFSKTTFNFEHKEHLFNDYKKQLLLPHKLSQTGPAFAKSDINNDGLEDLFIGGAHGEPGQLILNLPSGEFQKKNIPSFIKDQDFEDVAACFFDADNDGDQDLYVVSGSYEFEEKSMQLQDRLYLNDGKGNFSKAVNALPKFYAAGSVVKAGDFDKDGDLDLFVGSRIIPGKYPYAPTSYLLENTNGNFKIVTDSKAPELKNIGLVTAAEWADIDNDHDLDLIVTGEWMGIEVFENNHGSFTRSNSYKTLRTNTGWWNTLKIEDIDNDGDVDIIAGNLGLNSKYHATKEQPFHVYTNDYDNNGVEDIMLTKYYKNKLVPVRGKGCTAQQMPFLKDKIKTYNEFALNDISGILGNTFESSLHHQVTEFRSGIFINNNDKTFSFSPFPIEAQIAPINSIIFEDIDGDGFNDLLLAGNNYLSEIETTRSDAGIGVFLKGNAASNFDFIPNQTINFYADKDTRHMTSIKTSKEQKIIIINNNSKHQAFEIENFHTTEKTHK